MRIFEERECPICGHHSKQMKKHWKSKHQHEMSYSELMTIYQNYPKCKYCGKPLTPVVIDRVPQFCDYSCEMKFRNKYGMSSHSRTCPICENKFRNYREHYEEFHSDLSFELFLAKLEGKDKVPKCRYCENDAEYSWSNRHYNLTCSNRECKSKLKMENACHLVGDDGELYLYLVGCWDQLNKEYVTKCGVSADLDRRLDFYKSVGYTLKRVLYTKGFASDITQYEKKVHTHGFQKYYMDFRRNRGTSNGFTEWYQSSEFKKIRDYLRDDLHLELEEISE